MTDRRERIIQSIIRIVQSVSEYLLISVVLVFILIAIYALWDISFVASKAQPSNYAIYKPGENKLSWEELKSANDEAVGWLEVYGTNIDYPVMQAKDNEKYLSTDPLGAFSVSGSIFLDYRNKRDFSDFNSIIHGHSMSHNAMFGDVSDFLDKEFLNKHQYGDLYFSETHHGLRIIGIAEVDAYKSGLHKIVIGGEEDKDWFFREIDASVKYPIAESDKNPDYKYVLLSTCTSAFTNGRHVLICILTDETYENTYAEDEKTKDTVGGPRIRIWAFLIVLLILILLLIIAKAMRDADRRREKKRFDEKS